MEHLSIKEIYDRLQELNGWDMHGFEITKEFEFNEFKEAVDFVHKVGEEAERQQHHPDIKINNKKVSITLTTHDAGGLTYKDFKMAKVIEQMV